MNDNKQQTIVIGGIRDCGKTTLIRGLIRSEKKRGLNIAGFKPFDTGLLKRNATETSSDAELICREMAGEPMENLVSPYIGHEDYPIEMTFRRDGVTLNWGFIGERIGLLNSLYDFTLIECPDSLFTPLHETKTTFEWLKELNAPILWIINPDQGNFEHNLAEIQHLLTLDIPTQFLFNNTSKNQDQDLVFFIWEKVEFFAQRQALGMIPFVKDIEANFDILAGKIEENVPTVIETLVSSNFVDFS